MILIVSMFLIAAGVNLFVASNLGSDTLTVLLDGLNRKFGISIGAASILTNSFLVLLAYSVNRKELGMSSVVLALFTGFFINNIQPFVSLLAIENLPFTGRLAVALSANLCFSISYALLIEYGEGMHAVDALLYFLQNKTGLTYVYGRILTDIIFLVSGFYLGGVVGIGTIFSFLITGPCTAFCLKMLKKNK